MSFRGKEYDGGFFGSNTDSSERRNSFNNEVPFGGDAPPKRTVKETKRLKFDEPEPSEENDRDRYLITYADLITLLLGLFIILYAMSNIDANKYKGVVAAMGNVFGNETDYSLMNKTNIIPKPSDNLTSELDKIISNYSYENSIRLEESERGITVHILDDVLFPPAGAILSEKSKEVLSNLARVLKELPNDIRVEGHTDNLPISNSVYPSNWHLSVDRALSTAYYLIQTEGLSPDKVSVVGYAEYRPIAPNDSKESRALNRRVDLVILK